MIKVVHYINQFFAQIGGEEMAHIPAAVSYTHLWEEELTMQCGFLQNLSVSHFSSLTRLSRLSSVCPR